MKDEFFDRLTHRHLRQAGGEQTTPFYSIPPHVAIFHDADVEETFEKCDYAIMTRLLGTTYIYEL